VKILTQFGGTWLDPPTPSKFGSELASVELNSSQSMMLLDLSVSICSMLESVFLRKVEIVGGVPLVVLR
jgi:hypothetical protein